MGYDANLFTQKHADNDVICQQCYNVQEEPMIVCVREHIFCKVCVDTWIGKGRKDCPSCHLNMLQETISSKRLESKVMSLQVRCPEKDSAAGGDAINCHHGHRNETALEPRRSLRRSTLAKRTKREANNVDVLNTSSAVFRPTQCPWVGTLTDYLEKHKRNECDYCSASCPFCNELVKVSKLKLHKEDECRERFVQCSLCKGVVKSRAMKTHKTLFCPSRPVRCKHCHAKIPFKDLGTRTHDPSNQNVVTFTGHMLVCPKASVPCDFARYGCKAMVNRDEMETHRHDSVHTELMFKKLAIIEDEEPWQKMNLSWRLSSKEISEMKETNTTLSKQIVLGEFSVILGIECRGANGDIWVHIRAKCEITRFITRFRQVTVTLGKGSTKTSWSWDNDHNNGGSLEPGDLEDAEGIFLLALNQVSGTENCCFDMLEKATELGEGDLTMTFQVRKPHTIVI
ncbi:Tnf receptor-associated factor 2 [Seminavis robusta]|uniref:Tnf receptor-associated factor 2 n=1 Tax=Seminavis robusta TaxID=568900 RepID=A0A9N8E9G7_9STRA|nr:Tnf receptor-associated factor 2 [Seminavis robusta]|eukprot:Sro841_g209480.1 Tnf receptor-associated factor 2 (455) ;mRNA; f:4410-5774